MLQRMAVAVMLCASWGAIRLYAQVDLDASEAVSPELQNAELLDAWNSIAKRIENRESWDVLRADLHAAIESNPLAEHVGLCRQLLASIDAVIQTPPLHDDITEDSEVPDLIKSLPKSSLNYRLAIAPNAYYESVGGFVWDYYSKLSMTFVPDPAMVLFSRGRVVIDPLIECLDDIRATHCVATSDDGMRQPTVARVCDVALALIEVLSGCTFRESNYNSPFVSEWTTDERGDLIRTIRKWRLATQSMSPSEAVLWQIENGPEKLRIQMIETLIARKDFEAALTYLEKVYREGSDEKLSLFANRMVRAGSREPIDRIHRLVDENKVREIDRDSILLIAHFGETRDFQLLVNLVESAGQHDDGALVMRIQIIVEALRAAKDRRAMMAVPVHIAVIQTMQDEWSVLLSEPMPRHAFPPILDKSIYAIQQFSGRGFGMHEESESFDRARACKAILKWWDEEGEGAFGLEQNKAHAPVGIR